MTKMRILPDFFRDLEAAIDWYEQQQVGLGLRFLDEVESKVREINSSPLSHPPLDARTRVAIVNTFPYGVYYRETPEELVVMGLFHLHRRPGLWRQRKP